MTRGRRPFPAGAVLAPAALLLALTAACGRDAPPPATGPAPSAADAFVTEGEALLARGDYAGAAERFERAVAVAPEHIAARYGLGTALSHLDRIPEAVAQFQWVDRLGGVRSPLASRAREWLARRNALAQRPTTKDEYVPLDQQASARVRGTLSWSGIPRQGRHARGCGVAAAECDGGAHALPGGRPRPGSVRVPPRSRGTLSAPCLGAHSRASSSGGNSSGAAGRGRAGGPHAGQRGGAG